jgi:hypothetical protein
LSLPYRALLPLLLLCTSGCGSQVETFFPPPTEPEKPGEASSFVAEKSGDVTGVVTWSGQTPEVPPIVYIAIRPDGLGCENRSIDNPNRPQIDASTKALAGAVVFLKGINPCAARPWDLPPVRVELGDRKITVVQGTRKDRVGFVRRGERFEAIATDGSYQILRGRGDDFFSMTLPQSDQPVSRVPGGGRRAELGNAARVELSSGTGSYWMRADLFVIDHPYYAVTDRDGRYTLSGVPPGDHEIAVWLAGWLPQTPERDADSTLIARMNYSSPLITTAFVQVSSARTTHVDLAVKVP